MTTRPTCPQCRTRPLAYDGAVYCGAACCAMAEMKMPPAQEGTYRCDACKHQFRAIDPMPYATNQEVACPKCHTGNDTWRVPDVSHINRVR